MADIRTVLTNAVALADGQTGALFGSQNPLVTQSASTSGVTNSVVSVLTYAGDEVIPVPDGAYAITVATSLDVTVTIANSELPAVPNVDGTINGGSAYKCLAGQSTTIPLGDTLTYNVMRITGKAGTKTVVGFNGATVTTKSMVLAAGYQTPTKGNSLGHISGPFEVFNYSNQLRVRQDGTVTKIAIWNVLVTGVLSVTVRIWRKVATKWYLVGESENLVPLLTPSAVTINTVTLTKPIYGCRQGDFISVQQVGAGSAYGALCDMSYTGSDSYYTSATDKWIQSGKIWTGETSGAVVVPVQLYMEQPNIVGVGDSQIANLPQGAVFAQENNVATVPVPRDTVLGYASEKLGSRTFQNMGRSGETTTNVEARFAADVVALAPTYSVILAGNNDIHTAVAVATPIAKYEAMIDAAIAAGIKPVVPLPLPCTHFTNALSQQMDLLRAGIIATCATRPTAIVVETKDALGQQRVHQDISRVQRDLVNITFTHLERTANVATAYTTSPHGLVAGNKINVKASEFADGADTSFNGTNLEVITRIDASTFTYASTGTTKVKTACVAGSLDHPIALITSTGHGLTSLMACTIAGVTAAGFNAVGVVITNQGANTFTYSNYGVTVADTADTTGYFTNIDIMGTTNRWDFIPAYDVGDGIHMSAAGNQVLGGLIADAIKTVEAL